MQDSIITVVSRAAITCATLLLTISVQAQTATPAPAHTATLPKVSTDANVPAAAARKQEAELARGGPLRWNEEDVTAAARLRTIRKETAAALQENLGVCKGGAAAERSACMKEARDTYQQEMEGAKARAASGQ